MHLAKSVCPVTCGVCDLGAPLPPAPAPTIATGTAHGWSGACASDEELFESLCYQRCNVSDSRFPFRTAACTCCSKSSSASCLNPSDYKTDCVQFGKARVPTFMKLPQLVSSSAACSVCLTGEEYFLGLCYKACSIASGGNAFVRTGSCTCCDVQDESKALDCANPAHYETNCGKYGVDFHGKSARIPFTSLTETEASRKGECNPCHADEELSYGLCYSTCANLTNGSYPIRTSACTCCSKQPCTDLDNLDTDCISFGSSQAFPRMMPPVWYLNG